MSRCTAPVRGHHSSSARANCPACGSYRSASYSPARWPQTYSLPGSSDGGWRSSRGSGSSTKPRWSPVESPVWYSPVEIRAFTPIRKMIEDQASSSGLRDFFLCHAWDDRGGAAKELHDTLEKCGVSIRFSEKDVTLGTPLLREIDRGLAKSRAGIVLVTSALLHRLKVESIADKELSALLARELLVPVVHGVTYEALREASPLLGSRSGLNTAEESLPTIAAKLAELVAL